MPNKRVALPIVDSARCTGCGWCVGAYPDNLLFLEVQEGKKSASLINADVCPGCAKCIPACNFGAIRMKKLIAQKEKAAVAQAASLQVIAAVPVTHHSLFATQPVLEYDRSSHPFRQLLVSQPLALRDGWVDIPERPGLGIEINREVIR